MKLTRSIALTILITLCMVPSFASAQARGGGGGMGVAQQLQQVLGQLNLTPDQDTKIKGIMKDAAQSMRDSMQGLQDATQEERRAKMADLQKLMTDTRDKVVAELTDDQKKKFYPLMAKAGLKQATDLLAAIKIAEKKNDIAEDKTKQLDTILDDSSKTLDGFKADADAVTDAASSTDFTQKMTKFQLDLRKQIMDVLGQEDTQSLMQSARQAMRPAAAGGKRNAPATAPDAK